MQLGPAQGHPNLQDTLLTPVLYGTSRNGGLLQAAGVGENKEQDVGVAEDRILSANMSQSQTLCWVLGLKKKQANGQDG